MQGAKATLLVIEDDADLSWLVSSSLRREGYRVLSASSGEAGVEKARRSRPDLVILDVMLPRMDGLEALGVLRRDTRVPVIFLTAKAEESDRIVGFKLGADDYVPKPFSMAELCARVKAVLRRSAGGRGKPEWSGPQLFGALAVDVARQDVRVSGRVVALAPREFDILKALVEAGGRVLSRPQLLEKAWGYDQDLELMTRTVDQHVARLRRKLGPQRGRIVTVKNSGYKLRAD